MHTDRTPVTLRREITPGDVERMMDWMGNPNVTRYLNEDKHVTGQLSQLLSTVPGPMLTYHFNRDCRFFLICPDDNDSVGFVKLKALAAPRTYEIVFAVGEEALWGRGLATGAIRSALRTAFFDWRAGKVVAKIYAENQRSIRAVKACSFTCEASHPTLCRYALTMEDYFRRPGH